MELFESAKALEDHLTALRREFHMYPEVSGCEKETSKRVAKYLKNLGYEVTERVGGYGVIAVLKGDKKGKTVALRADMDALQIEELNDLEYCSKNKGVMHACGHDNHITILLGAAKLLAERKEHLAGTVKLIFQPAEELSPVGGSRGMIKEGALDGVDAVFGLHVWPDLPHGKVGVRAGALMAASDHFTVEIHGKSSHAAMPEEGIDSIVLGSRFVELIQSVISRELSPLQSAVITIGTFEAGTRYNIVAEKCHMEGTCRTLHEPVRNYVEKRMREILSGLCQMYHVKGELEYLRGYMSLVNDAEMTEMIKETAIRLFGMEGVEEIKNPSMCGEDFSFYLKERPGAFVWLGTGTEELCYPLHSSRFNVKEDILWRGAALMAGTAVDFLKQGELI